MKKYYRLLSTLVAILVIISSITFSGIAFGEKENLPKQNQGQGQDKEKEDKDKGDKKEKEDKVKEDKDKDKEDKDKDKEDKDEKEDKIKEDKVKEDKDKEDKIKEDKGKEDKDGLDSEQVLVKAQETGSLKVHKRIEDKDGKNASFKDSFLIRLEGPNGYNETQVISKKDNSGDQTTFENLPFGTYILSEDMTAIQLGLYDNYYITLQNGKKTSSEVVIDKNGVEQRIIVNVLNGDPLPVSRGTIKVLKEVIDENEVSESMTTSNEDEETFEIQLWKDDIYEVQFVSNGANVEFRNLLPGTYQVKEALATGQNYTVSIENNGLVTIPEDLEDGEVYTVTVTNTIEKIDIPWNGGQIVVNKEVVGEIAVTTLAKTGEEQFEIGLFVGADKVDSKNISDDGTVTFDGLSEGTYEIRELLTVEQEEVYIKTFDVKVDEIIITKESPTKEINITNTVKTEDDEKDPDPKDPDPKDPDPKDPEPKDPDPRDPKPRDPRPKDIEESEIVILEEPITEAVPTPVYTTVEAPADEPEIEEVITDPTPLAVPVVPKLPKTGSVDPFMFSGLGTILLGLGLFLKKKE